ncbi:MAG: TIM barrel protein [Planctomycetota bacterium]
MDRRQFLQGSLLVPPAVACAVAPSAAPAPRPGKPFGLKFAPHFGLFREHAGDDPVEQLKFMADEGFRALEDNGMATRPIDEQVRIARAMEDLGIEMGVFVAHADFGAVTFASDSPEAWKRIEADLRRALEVAKRVRAKWCTVVPGCFEPGLEPDYQTANVVANLKRAADIAAEGNLVMVLEPLNAWTDHPGLFLTKIPQAFQLCRAVASPYCKILDDLYHQQISEGNLIPNLERAWDEIAYFQVGDNPGRNEPGTGEVNYKNVFRRIRELGFNGIVGMEHGAARGGKEGERAVIDAYRAVDPA